MLNNIIIIVYSPFSMLARVGLLPPTAFGCQLYNMQPLLKAPGFNPVQEGQLAVKKTLELVFSVNTPPTFPRGSWFRQEEHLAVKFCSNTRMKGMV